MVVVICYAPSSVHATTSFMNGKGFFCTSWKQVEKILPTFRQKYTGLRQGKDGHWSRTHSIYGCT